MENISSNLLPSPPSRTPYIPASKFILFLVAFLQKEYQQVQSQKPLTPQLLPIARFHALRVQGT